MNHTLTPQPRSGHRPGVTLIELTVIILALLTLVGLLFVGANSWKNGTDRARCLLNIRQMQMSVRAFSSATSHGPGTDLALVQPPVNLLSELIGPGKYVPALPSCPGNGLYLFAGDAVPEIGSLYMTCSLAMSKGRQPKEFGSW